jgi:hypothetical protein
MEDSPYLHGAFGKEVCRSFRSKVTNSNQPFGLKGCDDSSQVTVTGSEKSRLFGGGQFVGRSIAAAALQEN